MTKFTKILLVFALILLIELILIYRGYVLSKKSISPDIKDYPINQPIWVEKASVKLYH